MSMNSILNKPAPDFALSDIDGSVHRLSDYSGCWLLLVFHRHLG